MSSSQSAPQSKAVPKLQVNSIEEIKQDQKTQLQNSYNIWVTGRMNQSAGQSYENVLKNVGSFNSFVDGVKPMWEDENCKDGGRWVLRVPKTHSNKYWEDLLLAMIGEQFQQEGEVLGLVLSLKSQQDIISIWNRNGKDKAKVQSLKEDIESFLALDSEVQLTYEIFSEEKEKDAERKANFHKNTEEGWGKQEKQQDWQGSSRGRGGFRGGRGGRGRGGYNEH